MSVRGKSPIEFGDGYLTGRGTFQKLFEQGELKSYLEEQLRTEAIPGGVGVFLPVQGREPTPAIPRQSVPSQAGTGEEAASEGKVR